MSQAMKVGVIGCGAISGQYLTMAKNFSNIEISALADLDLERAKAAAEKHGVGRAMSVEQLLGDKSVELVLNLTIPKAHVSVTTAALEAGKHVYLEKPLSVDRTGGRKLLELASSKKLRIGCAPDTFMGAGLQTARRLIDAGAIGRPVAFSAAMQGRGHESWHPSPEFYYELGGGPMLDMGPYYVTALINLLGPVKRISGLASIAIPERTITSQPKFGKKFRVETPDHILGLMEFESGATGSIVQSFAVLEGGHMPSHPIIINGTEGALWVADPNYFDGHPKLRKVGEKEATEMPLEFVKGYGRAVGLADMAKAIRSKRPHRASGEQAYYALDLMLGFIDSSESGKHYQPVASYQRPLPMKADLPFGQLD